MATTPRVVTFGEIMLRLSPPGFERFFQSPVLGATFGGGEANVAVSLAQFGCDARYVTRLPAHAIGDGAIRMLRGEGVDTRFILRGGDRVGIYFAEAGASQRASTVIYDRANASIADCGPGMVDWAAALDGAQWFHTTGITPALGPAPAGAVAEAIVFARAHGVAVSIDLNFRKKLWSTAEAQRVMRPMVQGIDVVIANEEDIQAVLGIEVPHTDVTAGVLDVASYRAVAERVCTEFAVKRVAITLRESHSASDNGWSAVLYDAATHAFIQSQHYNVRVVDRIGGGDSFGAGLIYGLVTGRTPEQALRFAVAASALKQTIPGDANRVSVAEVDTLAKGDASGRVQR